MRGLIHGCREAKETLLADESRDTFPLAIASRGSKLLGGAIRTELTRAELGHASGGFFRKLRPMHVPSYRAVWV